MTNLRNHHFDESFNYNEDTEVEIDVDGQLEFVDENLKTDFGNEYNFTSAKEIYNKYGIEPYEDIKKAYIQSKLDEIMDEINDKLSKKGSKDLNLKDRKVVVELGTHNREWIDYLNNIITSNNYMTHILSTGENSEKRLHIEVLW